MAIPNRNSPRKSQSTAKTAPPTTPSSGTRRNPTISPRKTPIVKNEPKEVAIPLNRELSNFPVKLETLLPIKDEDVAMEPAPKPLPVQREEKPSLYTIYNSSSDISYVPEAALKEGVAMVKEIKEGVKTLELGSKMRREVWLREIESLEGQGSPTTLIAVCGATGAGKSSILNAILDDNIVPTSGMRACTAVVTEISYHVKKTIDADVSFLSEAEWREELAVLLQDLVDEDGNLKRSTDLNSDAGIAWQKVHAVYPTIVQEQLVRMSVDRIIAKDAKIANILGTTKKISAYNSKAFAKQIGKYIDSKDQKRGKKDKDKEKDKEKKKKNEPALWPLIRQVRVRCPSAALRTGAVLVDLPGVADANAARNSIAKTYMKKCDCIWILAPITRAVDDKTARDLLGDAFRMQLLNGNYDAHAITFIASKCDDISCTEVIRALHLEDEPELEVIEACIDQCADETKTTKKKKLEAENAIKRIDAELKHSRAILAEYDAHMSALENGEEFVPRLTAKNVPPKKTPEVKGKKRKSSSGGKKGSPKRRKSEDTDEERDEDEKMGSGVDSDSDLDSLSSSSESDSNSDSSSSSDSDGEDSDSDTGSQSGGSDSGSSSDGEDGTDKEQDEEETIESLKAKKEEVNLIIKATRDSLAEARQDKKKAADALAALKEDQVKAQREKNAYCSLKRSEFSRDVLKEDFRVGLKDLDDAAAEERDPENFDPTLDRRNYDEIDLPVFTCSARDYVRLTHQVKGDGDPSCFSNVKDTGIPALQEWCHGLTVSSRERAARNFLTHLKGFATSVQTYVQGIGDVTMIDREKLRKKWESTEDRVANFLRGLSDGDETDDTDDEPPLPNLDINGEPVGITPRLTKDFGEVVKGSVKELQHKFNDGLEDKCRVGAANAAEAAVQTSDSFAAGMHWATYRATLRRHGTWRQDLNVELLAPFSRNIASSWGKVFETDLLASFHKAADGVINKLVREVEASAPAGLKDRAKSQSEVCLDEAKSTMQKIIEVVRNSLTSEQKEISRCLAPHVQSQLSEGYDRAMEERGRGSVARQKLMFHNFVDECKNEVFEGGAEIILERLSKAAEVIGQALNEALQALAQKIEVSLAVLWEGPRNDPRQIRAREEVVDSVTKILHQVELWKQAEAKRTLG